PIVGTIQDTLSVSTDNVNWMVFATSAPRAITVPTYTPGPPYVTNGGFSDLTIPPQYQYYRLGAVIQPDGGCQSIGYGSPGQPICRAATVTPHPSSTPTGTPTLTPSVTPTTTPTHNPCLGPGAWLLCTPPPLPTYAPTLTPSATPTETP